MAWRSKSALVQPPEGKELDPAIPCGVLVPESGLVNAGLATKLFGLSTSTRLRLLSEEMVSECHEHGIKVTVDHQHHGGT